MNQQLEKLETAIIMLLRDQSAVFYAALLLQMIRTETEKIPTMGVSVQDGRVYLYYNPKFIEKLKVSELIAVMEHEVLHLVMEHIWRSRGKFQKIWNMAADIAINQLLKDLPKDCLTPQQFKLPPNKYAEFYYAKMMDKAELVNGQGQAGGTDGQGIDDHSTWGEPKGKESEDMDKEVVRQAIADANDQVQKKQGHMPAGIEDFIKEWLKKPEVPWQTLLRQYVGKTVKANYKYSWKRTSRRFGPEQKGQIPQRTIKLAIAIDTSGSVSNEDFQEFIAEMKSIQKCYRNETWILECDAEVQKKYLLRPYSKIDTKFKGRGGTAYEPIFNAIEKEQKLKPDLLVYFTDFYCTFPSTRPKYNVLWVVTTSGDKKNKAPWGGTIHMKKKQGSKKAEDE